MIEEASNGQRNLGLQFSNIVSINRILGIVALVGYIMTIPVANWMIGHVGTSCIPTGPCLIPVGFKLFAPSGVLVIGVGLVLRDAVHSALGARVAVAAIVIGTFISALVAPASLVFAAAIAFGLSEFADFVVYAPLRERRLILAVLFSGVFGSIIDSSVFLWLAFGSLDYVAGQVVGKIWMTLFAIPVIVVFRRLGDTRRMKALGET